MLDLSLDFFLGRSLDSNGLDKHVSLAGRPVALMVLLVLFLRLMLRVTLAYHNAHIWSDLVAAILVVQCCIAVIYCHALPLTE